MTSPLDEILKQRGTVHGDFTDVADVSQQLKAVLQTGKSWNELTAVQKESLEMIMHKAARIVSGNPNHHDHWDDVAGYATITSKRIV